jgi:hypothetical protein
MSPLLLQTPDTPAGWLLAVAVVAGVVGAAAAVAAAAAAWTLVARHRELAARARALEHLEGLARDVSALAADRGDLDLRRIEHVLIELRDAQKRLEDVLLRHAEATRAAVLAGDPSTALVPAASGGEMVGERAINRLLAMGYERIQIVTRAEKLAELAARDGEVLVEARKEGVLHKGRVLVRSGRIANVELHPAYSIFP